MASKLLWVGGCAWGLVVANCTADDAQPSSPADASAGDPAAGGGDTTVAGGAVGEAPRPTGGAAGEGSRPSPEGGAAGGPEQTEGGAGMAAGGADALIEAAEQDVDADSIVTEPALLAGLAFQLQGSLCPGGAWEGDLHSLDPDSGAELYSLDTFFLRRARDGGLELVTSTGAFADRSGGDSAGRLVQVTPLRRSSAGFDAEGVFTCVRFEQVQIDYGFGSNRYAAERLHLVFWQDAQSGTARARVAIDTDAEPLLSDAEPDVTAPQWSQVQLHAHLYAIDELDASGFNRNFVFSEPLAEDAEVSVTTEGGQPLDFEYFVSEGYRVGFKWNDALAGNVNVSLHLVDVSGNERDDTRKIPIVELTPIDGDIEAGVAFMDPDPWRGAGVDYCSTAGAYATPADSTFPETDVDVPPLAGSASFLTSDENCAIGFRLMRSQGATKVSFDARRIGARSGSGTPAVEVCIDSLGVGGDAICSEQALTAEDDAAFAAASLPVSVPQTFSFPLPLGVDDMLVTIRADLPLWFDSLRTAP